jgi:glycosyltransferase involved in cell wall biosynthesis
LGAPASRNIGIEESGADWILFLDDDVIPDSDILTQYVSAIRRADAREPLGAASITGFVGRTTFPKSEATFHRAVNISAINSFYDIASTRAECPWGVTANIAMRRTRARFDVDFPRTGGGEDIDFCVKQPGRLVSVPEAHAVHPWCADHLSSAVSSRLTGIGVSSCRWDAGQRCYRHFYNWGHGDGQLIHKHRHLTFRSPPNAYEALLVLALLCALVGFQRLVAGDLAFVTRIAAFFVRCVLFIAIAELVFETTMNMFVRMWAMPKLRGLARLPAAFEAGLLKNAVEWGRFRGHLKRHRYGNLMRRFDWFAGLNQTAMFEWRRDGWLAAAGFGTAIVLAGVVSF